MKKALFALAVAALSAWAGEGPGGDPFQSAGGAVPGNRIDDLVVAELTARGIEPAALGIGIATGEVTVGEFGCEQRTDYTIIGHTANLGARICGVAKAGEVLVGPETYALIKDSVEATPVSGVHLKGIDAALTVYSVSRVLD